MSIWETWQGLGQTAWDWGSKMGLGGLLVGVGSWLLRRKIGERDKAVERGRDLVKEARPEVVIDSSAFAQHRGSFQLHNRGPGHARNVEVMFTGSRGMARVREVPSGARPLTPEVDFGDSSFFREAGIGLAELTVSCENRFGDKYSVVLPVHQEHRADGRFNMLPQWGQHRVLEPKPTKKRLREIGRS